ncbi:MAG: tetratricopeptide repeat protein [Elusimicrobiota bacterium]
MRGRALLLAALCAAPLAARAATVTAAPSDEKQELLDFKGHYKQAFEYYTAGQFTKAIKEWNEVLAIDRNQKTAEKMIRDARTKIDERDKKAQDSLFDNVAEGDYQAAYLELQPLLGRDPDHPLYVKLQNRLELLTEVIKKAPHQQAWVRAARGLTGYIAREDNLRLAYNGLRHAKDLNAGEKRFDLILQLILKEDKTLADEKITPGMKLIDYKRVIALDYIYDGKYHFAIKQLNEVLALEPNDIDSLKRLGSAYYQLKRYPQARQIWGRALKLAPKDKTLQKFLARAQRAENAPKKNTPSNRATRQRRKPRP